jgi:hypothetical protein
MMQPNDPFAGIDTRKPKPGDLYDPEFWTRRDKKKPKKKPSVPFVGTLPEIFNAEQSSYYVYKSSAGKVFIRHKPLILGKHRKKGTKKLVRQDPPIKYMGRSCVGSSKDVLRAAKVRYNHGEKD